jgi:predicted glycosyltransferase
MNGSVLFYVQHLLGIGHVRRAFRLAEAVAREGIKVTLVSGGEPPVETLDAEFAHIVQLAPIKSQDATFKNLVDPNGQAIDEKFKKIRRDTLVATFESVRPDAVVIEAFPFGRRAFRFEIEPLIEAARSCCPKPRILCSVRDIVVVPDEPSRIREIIDRVRADFDFVLVHGDPAFIPLEASFPAASHIADRIIYTGYVGNWEQAEEEDEAARANEVLSRLAEELSVPPSRRRRSMRGDGLSYRFDGACSPDLTCRSRSSAGWRSFASERVLERYRRIPDVARCRVLRAAGYNTVDILAGARAVVVPSRPSVKPSNSCERNDRPRQGSSSWFQKPNSPPLHSLMPSNAQPGAIVGRSRSICAGHVTRPG